jgi:hypothetical protein
MFHDIGRLKVLALATLGAVAAGCSSTSGISSRGLNESAYPPERLLAIAEVFERQGNTTRAGDLYVYVRQSSPELAQDAENHLRLMAQGVARSRLEAREQAIAQGAAPKKTQSQAAAPNAGVAQSRSQAAAPKAVVRSQPRAAAPRAVAQAPRQSPQSQASAQQYGLVDYRRSGPASNSGLATAEMAEPEEPAGEDEPLESGEMPQVTPAPPSEDAEDLEDAAEPAEAADALDMPESADAPEEDEMQGAEEPPPTEAFEEDGGSMDEGDEPPAISEGPEEASDEAPDGDPQEEPADESIPGIDEVLRDLKSADPDRRLAAAMQVTSRGMDVVPILRSLRQSMHRTTSQVVRVQLADAILLLSPHETDVVRFLLQVEKSEDLAAAELAHELLDSLIDRLVGSKSAIGRRGGNSHAQVAGSPAVASSRGARGE